MSSTENPEPISIHISPTLKHLTIPLKEFLHNHPQYACLAVGAFIFAPAHQVTSSSPETTSSVSRLLIVQRAASEKSFPTLWEVPGGSSEHSDPTILHSVAREVFEETGLHLTRLVRQIGKGVEFSVGRSGGPERWLKLSFEVEVTEIEPTHSNLFGDSQVHTQEHFSRAPVDVSLDPNEHQDHRWVSEAEIENAGKIGGLQMVTEDQHAVMLEAFQLHNSNRAVVETAITRQ